MNVIRSISFVPTIGQPPFTERKGHCPGRTKWYRLPARCWGPGKTNTWHDPPENCILAPFLSHILH